MATRRNAKPEETTVGVQPGDPEAVSAVAVADPVYPVIDHEEIARLAYSYWEARGCCGDTPEEDWFRAEEELRKGTAAAARTAAA